MGWLVTGANLEFAPVTSRLLQWPATPHPMDKKIRKKIRKEQLIFQKRCFYLKKSRHPLKTERQLQQSVQIAALQSSISPVVGVSPPPLVVHLAPPIHKVFPISIHLVPSDPHQHQDILPLKHYITVCRIHKGTEEIFNSY